MENIKELQITLTDLAVKVALFYKVKLDFSLNSVKKVEDVLSKISEEYKKNQNEEGIEGIALEFAAYIITVIERNLLLGKWQRDSELGKDTFPYDLGNNNYIFPYAWCQKRIFDGDEDNVWQKFKTLVLDKYQN